MIAAVLLADHRVLGAAHRQAARIRDQGAGQRVAGAGALEEQLAHVGEVEQARALAHGSVLLEDAAVLDGHRPAAELDQTGAQSTMDLDKRGEPG